MMKYVRALLTAGALTFCSTGQALDQMQAEELAELTAILVYVKTQCGYEELPAPLVRQGLAFFAMKKGWNMDNYASFNMTQLNQENFNDLKHIPVDQKKKCKSLAPGALNLLAQVS